MRIWLDSGILHTSLLYQLWLIRVQDSVLPPKRQSPNKGRTSGGANLPGSGATSLGAALRGASKSTWTGSSSDGAMAIVGCECLRGCRVYIVACWKKVGGA